MSSNHRCYVSPRIFSMDLSIDSDESNLDIFDDNTTNDYPVSENMFDEDMINTDNPGEIVDIIDNNKHKDTLSNKSFTTICNGLYNVMKNNKTISTFIVGILLERKMVISSNQTQNLDLNRMITHFDKKTFTPLEKETNLNFNESTSCSLKLNVKRRSQHEIKRKGDKPNSTLLSPKKTESCEFCSISGHRTTGCANKSKFWNRYLWRQFNRIFRNKLSI